jgi:hypothetical protein
MSGGVPVGLPPGGVVPVGLPAPGAPALPTVDPAPQPGRAGMPVLGAVLGVFCPVVVPGTV